MAEKSLTRGENMAGEKVIKFTFIFKFILKY